MASTASYFKFLCEFKNMVTKIPCMVIDDFSCLYGIPSDIENVLKGYVLKNTSKFKTPRWEWYAGGITMEIAIKVRDMLEFSDVKMKPVDIPDDATDIERKILTVIHELKFECDNNPNLFLKDLYEKHKIYSNYAAAISSCLCNINGVRNTPEWKWKNEYPINIETARNIITEAKSIGKLYY